MKTKFWQPCFVGAFVFFALACPLVWAQTPQYTIEYLGTLGNTSSRGVGINDSGQVTGMSGDAFLYSGGAMQDLGTLGGTYSGGAGVNNSGHVTGTSQTSSGYDHAFLYFDGTMHDLGTLGDRTSDARGINNSGQITGYSYPASSGVRAFLYSGGTMQNLGTLAGGIASRGFGINDSGQITGDSVAPDSVTSLFVRHAFLYSDGTMHDLGSLGVPDRESQGYGINNLGEVTGDFVTLGNTIHAFLYSGGMMYDLNTLIPAESGWVLLSGYAINDRGQITGYGLHNGISGARAFLATPRILTSLHRIGSPAAAANLTAGVDTALEPTASETILDAQPFVSNGLAADGVTPLLIRIQQATTPTEPTNYQISLTVDSATGSISGDLNQRLKVLQFSGSQGGLAKVIRSHCRLSIRKALPTFPRSIMKI